MLKGSWLGWGASSHVEMVGVSRHQTTQRPATLTEGGLLAFFSQSLHVKVTYFLVPKKHHDEQLCQAWDRQEGSWAWGTLLS